MGGFTDEGLAALDAALAGHTPDQWIAAFGSLPLLDQPGERFRYNTGATVAGVLIERVAGAPFAEVLGSASQEPVGEGVPA